MTQRERKGQELTCPCFAGVCFVVLYSALPLHSLPPRMQLWVPHFHCCCCCRCQTATSPRQNIHRRWRSPHRHISSGKKNCDHYLLQTLTDKYNMIRDQGNWLHVKTEKGELGEGGGDSSCLVVPSTILQLKISQGSAWWWWCRGRREKISNLILVNLMESYQVQE